jgi:hypothetical protein
MASQLRLQKSFESCYTRRQPVYALIRQTTGQRAELARARCSRHTVKFAFESVQEAHQASLTSDGCRFVCFHRFCSKRFSNVVCRGSRAVVHLGSSSMSAFSSKASKAASFPRPHSCPPTPERRRSDELPQVSSLRGPSPRALRRRARSSIIDIFRLYVQSELSTRLPSGGYYVWVAKSMHKRASHRMEMILREAGMQPLQIAESYGDQSSSLPCSPGLTPDDETDVDMDGFSIRTPSSQTIPNSFYFVPSSNGSVDSLCCSLEHSLAPESTSPELYAEFRSLSGVCAQMKQIVAASYARLAQRDQEKAQKESMLEVRSRRRAWLNMSISRLLCSPTDTGLSAPFRKSPLNFVAWSAEKFDSDENVSPTWANFHVSEASGLGRVRSRKSSPPLFPVSEEVEEELIEHAITKEFDSLDLTTSMYSASNEDLELGLAGSFLDTSLSPPRTRTDSIPPRTKLTMQSQRHPTVFTLPAKSPNDKRNRYDRCFSGGHLPQTVGYPSLSDNPYGSFDDEKVPYLHDSSLSQAEQGIFAAATI